MEEQAERSGGRRKLFEGDKAVWVILLFLGMISVIEVYSASANMTYKSGAYWKPVLQHLTYYLMGVGAAVVVHKIPCRMFKMIPVIGIPVTAVMLVVALFAEKVNNASRWLEIGGIGFQPSEIAKVVLAVTVAMILSSMRDERGAQTRGFWWTLCVTGLFCLLIVPENFSTAGIMFLVVMMMMFVGEVRWVQLGTLLGILFICAAALVTFLRFTPDATVARLSEMPGLHRLPTWAERLNNSIGTSDKEGRDAVYFSEHLQETHARIAIATCNVVGLGPGNSVERDFLPQSFSDFIYAIIFEEMGFAGGFFVMLLYIILLFRCARIAGRCERPFPALLVMGLSLMLVTQAMINMAVAVGVFPVTGQPLPLISKGGTSTLINCVYIGMILSVSRSARRRTSEKKAEV